MASSFLDGGELCTEEVYEMKSVIKHLMDEEVKQSYIDHEGQVIRFDTVFSEVGLSETVKSMIAELIARQQAGCQDSKSRPATRL